MSLEIIINTDIKEAMKAKDRKKLDALRAIKSELLLIKTGKDTSTSEVPEELEMKVLQKLVKQRRESASTYIEQGREDLAAEESFQLSIIEKYLPKQLSAEEIELAVKQKIAELGATSMKDMGKVMGSLTKDLAGRADNKTVSTLIRKFLS